MQVICAVVVGLLQGILAVPVSLLLTFPGVLLVAVCWLPVIAQDSLSAFLSSPRAGTSLRVLAALTVWPCFVLLWLPIWLLAAFGVVVCSPAMAVDREVKNARAGEPFRFDGYVRTVDRLVALPGTVWNLHRDSVLDLLSEIRRPRSAPPIKLPFHQWPYCLILVFAGMILFGFGAAGQMFLKVLPGAFAMTARVDPQGKGPVQCISRLFLWILGPLVCMPILLLLTFLTLPMAVLYGATVPFSAVISRRSPGASWGIMKEWLFTFDAWINSQILGLPPTPVLFKCKEAKETADDPQEGSGDGGDAGDWAAVWFGGG
eukprot:Hpha_TRINITY_DN16129_c1_g2::TRINITY_DN16129_c1_g2_i1::g.8364::m.8364